MAQGIAIFTDGELTSGRDLKGKVPRSKNKALCDVKNTLLSKAAPAAKELLKNDLGPLKSDSMCKAPVKELVEGTPAKSLLKQEGTFKIACDDKENEVGSWDPCQNPECKNPEDFFPIRSPSEQYRDEDIAYLRKGLFSMHVRPPTSPSFSDIEIDLPTVSEPFNDFDWDPIKTFGFGNSPLRMPSPIPLTDEEEIDD